ncbi:MAG: hypothetical protein AAF996_03540 [Pseudomonadota bacterium]
MLETTISVAFLANAIWYGMGFVAFYVRRDVFAKVMVPIREDRQNSAFAAVVESGRFMGGFNFALSVLNVCLFFNVAGLETDAQLSLMLSFNALAHGSQFFGNVPMALKNRKGDGLWNVFTGVMLQIFVIDFVLMSLNAALALIVLL